MMSALLLPIGFFVFLLCLCLMLDVFAPYDLAWLRGALSRHRWMRCMLAMSLGGLLVACALNYVRDAVFMPDLEQSIRHDQPWLANSDFTSVDLNWDGTEAVVVANRQTSIGCGEFETYRLRFRLIEGYWRLIGSTITNSWSNMCK